MIKNNRRCSGDHSFSAGRGFTLVEILVVIAIIGILVSISVVSFANVRAKGRDTQRLSDIKLIQVALENYYRTEGTYPSGLTPGQPLIGAISSTTYMAKVPLAPDQADGGCGTSSGEYSYTYIPETKSYQLSFCLGSATGAEPSGPKCATPSGILNTDCSVY